MNRSSPHSSDPRAICSVRVIPRSQSRVLLVNPHEMTQDGHIGPRLGLLYLAGTLLAHGHDVRIVDGRLDGPDGIRAAIREYRPDLVGITTLTPARKRAFEVAAWSKKLLPGAPVVLGGAHPTIMYEQVLTQYPSVDYVVRGEGERGLLEIVEGRDPLEIRGIAFRDEHGIRTTRHRPPVTNLDEIPLPAWHLVDLNRYPLAGQRLGEKPNRRHKEPQVHVLFSRGCLGHCDFCSNWWIGSRWRRRSPGNMVDELELLNRKYHVESFGFADDMMTGDMPATIELCDLIVERGLKIRFTVTTRTDCVSSALLSKLKAAGCYNINYGIESGSAEILESMGKDSLVENSIRAIQLTHRAGIAACALIMVGNRGETEETVRATVELLRMARPDSVGCAGGLWIFPGTKLYRQCRKNGYIDDDFWLSDEPYKIYALEHDMDDLHRFARMVTYYDLPRKLKALGEIVVRRPGRLIELGIEFLRRRDHNTTVRPS